MQEQQDCSNRTMLVPVYTAWSRHGGGRRNRHAEVDSCVNVQHVLSRRCLKASSSDRDGVISLFFPRWERSPQWDDIKAERWAELGIAPFFCGGAGRRDYLLQIRADLCYNHDWSSKATSPGFHWICCIFFPPTLPQHLVRIMAEAPDVNRLSTAAARGDLAETKKILESNINVNAKNKFGRTPLQVGDHHELYTHLVLISCAFIFLFLPPFFLFFSFFLSFF